MDEMIQGIIKKIQLVMIWIIASLITSRPTRITVIIVVMSLVPGYLYCQVEESGLEMQEELQVEAQANETGTEGDDDSYLLQLAEHRKHPLNLNYADETDLLELRILTALQVQQFLGYRTVFGRLISVYELQAVPGWDLETIRKIRSVVTVRDRAELQQNITGRLRQGYSNIMIRSSMVPELSAGYLAEDTGSRKYPGSNLRLFARYLYNYKNLLQFGITADKDAGEQFFKGAQKAGFDFYSWHIFLRQLGPINSLAIGDFTISMGQGLIHWQGNGLRKNADAMMIKRQGQPVRPYRSGGEYNFNRGIAASMHFRKIELTVFGSMRRLSASTDLVAGGEYVSSIITSGYHRTVAEQEKRKNLGSLSAGMIVKYRSGRGAISFNAIHHRYSMPLKPQDKPYDLYGIAGANWTNYSTDYSYTLRNLHCYGEFAVDRNGKLALMQGMLLGLDKKLDFSLVYRKLHPAYQSISGNAFTENSLPSNESGVYAGFVLRPRQGWTISLYADFFSSPWLRFKTDAPAIGRGYLFQVSHIPRRGTELYSRFSNEQKHLNVSGSVEVLPEIAYISRKEWRFQFSQQFSKTVLFRSRVSVSWFGKVGDTQPEKGFLAFTDLVWKPAKGNVSGSGRLQYFDMDSYNTRIYAYENGPMYDMSIPGFFDRGFRYYLNGRIEPRLKLPGINTWTLWVKYGGILNTGSGSFGSGLDKIYRSSRSEVKFQVIMNF